MDEPALSDSPIRLPSGWSVGRETRIERDLGIVPVHLLSSIVLLMRQTPSLHVRLVGSAFFIAPWGLLATAHHVAFDDELPEIDPDVVRDGGLVTFPNPHGLYAIVPRAEHDFIAMPVKRTLLSPYNSDLALLELDMRDFPKWIEGTPIAFRLTSDAPQPGRECCAMGYADIEPNRWFSHREVKATLRAPLRVRVGVIEEVMGHGRDTSLAPHPCFSVSTTYPHGMSGGPVFNESGHVIGVASAGWTFDDTVEPLSLASLWAPFLWFSVADPTNPGHDSLIVDLLKRGLIPSAGTGDVRLEHDGEKFAVTWI